MLKTGTNIDKWNHDPTLIQALTGNAILTLILLHTPPDARYAQFPPAMAALPSQHQYLCTPSEVEEEISRLKQNWHGEEDVSLLPKHLPEIDLFGRQ